MPSAAYCPSWYDFRQTLLLERVRLEWMKRERERRCRHYEEMTGKQKIAAGGGTPTTIEKEKLLQSDDTIISGKSQVRSAHKNEKEF